MIYSRHSNSPAGTAPFAIQKLSTLVVRLADVPGEKARGSNSTVWQSAEGM